MKKFLSLIAIVLLAIPVLAQDEIILSQSDIDALLGGGGNRGNRGNNNNQPQIPDPVYMFEDLKALLKNNKVALDKPQEKALQAFLNTETVAMRTALEAQFSNRGNSNGNRGNNNQVNMITDLTASVTKHNTDLLTEIKASLMPDQVALVTKAEKDKKACTVMLDLINFQELQNRLSNNQNNFNGGGRGGGGFPGGGFDGGGFDFPGGFEFPGGGGGGGNRGGNNNNNAMLQILPSRASCTSRDSTPAQRLAVLGDLLTKGKKPLTADQGTKFTPLIEARMNTILDELKAKDPQIDQLLNSMNQNRNNQNQNQTQTQPQAPQVNVQTLTNNIVNTIMQNLGIQNQNNNNNNRGGRGNNNQNQPNNNQPNANANNANNNAGRGNQQNFNPQAEIQKKNEELFDKVAAMLKPEQQPFVKNVKFDQIKARGGADKYRGILEQEGTPLTPAQFTQIQALINTSNTAVRNFAQTLVTTEIQALAPGALQAAALQYQQQQQQLEQQQQNPQQNRNNNNQLNNVNQNTVAQQIVGKVLPQVSVQRGRLEKAASDSILRVLSPAQQASYKVNQMN